MKSRTGISQLLFAVVVISSYVGFSIAPNATNLTPSAAAKVGGTQPSFTGSSPSVYFKASIGQGTHFIHHEIFGSNCGGPISNSFDSTIFYGPLTLRSSLLLIKQDNQWVSASVSETAATSTGLGQSSFTSTLDTGGVVTTSENGSYVTTTENATVTSTESIDLNTGVFTWQRSVVHVAGGDCPYSFTETQDRTAVFPISLLSFTPVDKPDFSVSQNNIGVAQVVWNPDINSDGRTDLVLNKPMVVRVYPNLLNIGNLTSSLMVEVRAALQGQSDTRSISVNDLLAQRPIDLFVTPTQAGDAVINVTVDPIGLISESNEANNHASLNVSVKRVPDTRYLYYNVDYLGANPHFASMVANSSDFLKAVYPIDPSNYSWSTRSYYPTANSYDSEFLGLYEDVWNIWLSTAMDSFKAKRSVGIVSERWINYHLGFANPLGFYITGVTPPDMMNEVSFVLDNHPLTTAHELGHSYGMDHTYTIDPHYQGPAASGYWVDGPLGAIEVKNSIDYMGEDALILPGVIYDEVPYPTTVRWSTMSDFVRLFQKFLTQPEDPEILLVTGTINQNNVVTFKKMYRLPEGIISQRTPGDGSVRVLDINGNIVSELLFTVDFGIFVDPLGIKIVDTAPFAFSVAYPADAASVQIVRNGQVLAQTFIASKLLRDAVTSIPDQGFVRNSAELRAALLNKVDALETQLAAGDFAGAKNKLRNDIRRALAEWLINEYPTQSVLQYTKPGILSLVDELLQRMSS